MDVLWVLSVSMLTACVAIPMDAAAGSHSLFTCEPITLRMCQGLSYNSTFMPNVLNHYDQQTAALAMEVKYLLTLSAGRKRTDTSALQLRVYLQIVEGLGPDFNFSLLQNFSGSSLLFIFNMW